MTRFYDLKRLMEKALDGIQSGDPHTAEVFLELALDGVYADLGLLAALERLVSATSMGFVDRDEAEEGEAWEQASAAIAKAKGSAP